MNIRITDEAIIWNQRQGTGISQPGCTGSTIAKELAVLDSNISTAHSIKPGR